MHTPEPFFMFPEFMTEELTFLTLDVYSSCADESDVT